MSTNIIYIITGTSAGIGNAIANKVLEDNQSYVVGINRRKSDIVPDNYYEIIYDLSDLDRFDILFTEIISVIDKYSVNKIVLINNAGTAQPISFIHKTNDSDIRYTYNLNVLSVIMMNKHLVKYLREKGLRGLIINI